MKTISVKQWRHIIVTAALLLLLTFLFSYKRPRLRIALTGYSKYYETFDRTEADLMAGDGVAVIIHSRAEFDSHLDEIVPPSYAAVLKEQFEDSFQEGFLLIYVSRIVDPVETIDYTAEFSRDKKELTIIREKRFSTIVPDVVGQESLLVEVPSQYVGTLENVAFIEKAVRTDTLWDAQFTRQP